MRVVMLTLQYRSTIRLRFRVGELLETFACTSATNHPKLDWRLSRVSSEMETVNALQCPLTWFLRKATASSLEHRLVAKVFRSFVAS